MIPDIISWATQQAKAWEDTQLITLEVLKRYSDYSTVAEALTYMYTHLSRILELDNGRDAGARRL